MDFSSIPDEIKLFIISYLPLHKLISDNPLPIFNEYIMNYINTKLLLDNYNAGYLSKSIYKDILFDKAKEIAFNIADEFIKETEKIGGPIITNDTEPIISLNILFKFTRVGRHYNGNTRDINYSLSSYGVFNNSFTWYYNQTLLTLKYSKENIRNEIWRIIIKNIDYSDTTLDIKSMELVKTNILNTNNEILIKYI